MAVLLLRSGKMRVHKTDASRQSGGGAGAEEKKKN